MSVPEVAMPSVARQRPSDEEVTVDAFLDLAAKTEDRLQLVDGQVVAIAPSSATHGIIQANLCGLLFNALRGRSNFRVVTEPAINPRVRAEYNVRVPDLGVTCAPNTKGQVVVPDPILLVEILSPSNRRDTWGNVWAYTSLPSVHEILFVSSWAVEARLLRRGVEGQWPQNTLPLTSEDRLALETVGLSVPLRDVYAGTYLVD